MRVCHHATWLGCENLNCSISVLPRISHPSLWNPHAGRCISYPSFPSLPSPIVLSHASLSQRLCPQPYSPRSGGVRTNEYRTRSMSMVRDNLYSPSLRCRRWAVPMLDVRRLEYLLSRRRNPSASITSMTTQFLLSYNIDDDESRIPPMTQ